MRSSLVLLVSASVLAEPPDPTVIAPAPVEEAPVKDVCDVSPRCRIARFRAELARQRRAEYLMRLDAASREMEKRIRRGTPFRVRHPVDANFVFISNALSYGALVGYSPTFWVKLEGFAAGFDYSKYQNGYYRFHGFSGGIDVRFLPTKFPLSPYFATGWNYLAGPSSYYNYDQGANVQGSGEAHALTLGLGAELTVPYFHFSLGYQFQEAFYAQAKVGDEHDATLRGGLKSGMEAARHGAVLEIGCAF